MTTTELETQARGLLRPDPENPGRLKSRESTRLEFKESFSRAGRAKYAKTLAAFANNSGGFIVFGVTDSPRELVGVDGERFDAFASESLSGYLNATLAPELEWEAFTTRVGDVLLGVLHVAKAKARPVVALRNDADVIRESDIFYRYRARSERIRYAGEVRSLLARGADPNVPDRAGRTALHGAARLGRVETMSALLDAGGNPNQRDEDGNTPLHFASDASQPTLMVSQSIATIRVLLNARANPDTANAAGRNPLHLAAGSHTEPESRRVSALYCADRTHPRGA